MIYLTASQVIELHQAILAESGGTKGILSEKQLISCVERPSASVHGFDIYPEIFMKAAALMYCIILFHPFIDGNKRTGLIAAIIFLELNGYMTILEKAEAVQFTIEVANGNVEEHEIAEWLRRHSRSQII